MKTVYLNREYAYRPHPKITVLFKQGFTYRRVLEAAATCIVRDGAGRIVAPDEPEPKPVVDASRAWQLKRRKPLWRS